MGHLGTPQLAALGAASAILLTATGLFVFLAYATTSVVSRHLGAGRRDDAVQAGLDRVWLAALLGLPLALFMFMFAHPLALAMGGADVAAPAAGYLRISAAGIPAMLILLAVQGLLRGLQDTRTPLWVTGIGFGLNAALNALLVLGLHLGLAGSALGTVIAQWLMALAMLAIVVSRTRHLDLRPHPGRVLASARVGAPLLVRTAALRGVLLVTTAAAGTFGTASLAAHQVASTLFGFLTFALDAVAIAAQALVGESLGSSETARTRDLTAVIVRWGWWSGVGAGVLTLAGARWLPMLFTSDVQVRHGVTAALVVIALVQPVAGVLFVLDGVLMGAGDGPYLARAQLVLLALHLPVMAVAVWWVPRVLDVSRPVTAMLVLWIAYSLNLAVRCGLLDRRRRGTAWMTHALP